MTTYRLTETGGEQWSHRIDLVADSGAVTPSRYVVADIYGFDAVCTVLPGQKSGQWNAVLQMAADDPRDIAPSGSLEALARKFWNETLEKESRAFLGA